MGLRPGRCDSERLERPLALQQRQVLVPAHRDVPALSWRALYVYDEVGWG
jgi:hypothetical protein